MKHLILAKIATLKHDPDAEDHDFSVAYDALDSAFPTHWKAEDGDGVHLFRSKWTALAWCLLRGHPALFTWRNSCESCKLRVKPLYAACKAIAVNAFGALFGLGLYSAF